QNPAQGLEVASEISWIPHENREAAPSFDRRRRDLAACRRLDRVLNLHDREAVARGRVAVYDEVQIRSAGRPFGVDAASARQVLQSVLDVETDLFDRRIVGAVDLNADLRPHTG